MSRTYDFECGCPDIAEGLYKAFLLSLVSAFKGLEVDPAIDVNHIQEVSIIVNSIIIIIIAYSYALHLVGRTPDLLPARCQLHVYTPISVQRHSMSGQIPCERVWHAGTLW